MILSPCTTGSLVVCFNRVTIGSMHLKISSNYDLTESSRCRVDFHQVTFTRCRTALEDLIPDDHQLFVPMISDQETQCPAVLLTNYRDCFMDHCLWYIQRTYVR
jgi:hypothetical protein